MCSVRFNHFASSEAPLHKQCMSDKSCKGNGSVVEDCGACSPCELLHQTANAATAQLCKDQQRLLWRAIVCLACTKIIISWQACLLLLSLLLTLQLLLQGLRDKLTTPEAAPAARLSKKLVTIHTDIALPPVRFPMGHLALHPPTDLTRAAVKAAFASLEFAQHEKRLEAIWENMSRSQAQLKGEAWTEGWHSAIKPASEFVPS